ncbi:hypothetical protein [Thermomonospora amylolytica]|uniref:hypothetical protein n=1 Tax=Thermomonospora amylolytica TaxID=1411117 RepID=UPI00130039DB|nr:hypothetical protein [Thermomonospora amylolytica]
MTRSAPHLVVIGFDRPGQAAGSLAAWSAGHRRASADRDGPAGGSGASVADAEQQAQRDLHVVQDRLLDVADVLDEALGENGPTS